MAKLICLSDTDRGDKILLKTLKWPLEHSVLGQLIWREENELAREVYERDPLIFSKNQREQNQIELNGNLYKPKTAQFEEFSMA